MPRQNVRSLAMNDEARSWRKTGVQTVRSSAARISTAFAPIPFMDKMAGLPINPFPTLEQGFAEYAALLSAPAVDEVDEAGALEELPTPSHSCLQMLDPSIREAYVLAYERAKTAYGTAPDCTGIWDNSLLPHPHPTQVDPAFAD
ncbi:hypothetical protein V8E36_005529 [Tilletia maclaganii]